MKRSTATILAVSVALVPACAHRPLHQDAVMTAGGVVVDAKGKDKAQVMQDAQECYDIAVSTNQENKVAEGAVAGALVGALFGALVYRSAGLSGNRGAGYGAGYGAIGGAGGGAANAAQTLGAIQRNCLVGRGHMPLN